MKTKTTTEILLRARQYADAETGSGTTDFETDTELLSYLNEAYEDLVDEILEAGGMDLLLTTADLPDGDYDISTLGVYRDVGLARLENDGSETPLTRWTFRTRHTHRDTKYPAWRQIAGEIRFFPTAAAPGVLRYWYIPTIADFAPGDTVPVFGGWQSYLATRVAMKMLIKDERTSTTLEDEFKMARKRVMAACCELDLGEPEQVPITHHVAEEVFDEDVNGFVEYLPR